MPPSRHQISAAVCCAQGSELSATSANRADSPVRGIIPIACAVLLIASACTAARSTATDPLRGTALACKPATADEVARQSRQAVLAAEAVLANVRAERRVPEQVIRITPAASREETSDDTANIEAALQRARLIRAETGQPTTLAFAPGRYRLRRPIILTEADSGTSGAPLRFAASSSGPVILSGGVPLAQQPLPAALEGLLPLGQRSFIHGYAVPPQAVPSRPFPRLIGTVYAKPASFFAFQGDRPIWRSALPHVGYAVEPVANPQPGPVVVPQVTVARGLSQLLREPSLQAGGYWTFDWAYEENQVTLASGKSAAGRPPSLAIPQLKTTYAQSPLMRYRLLNGFGFINRPGEMAYADGVLAAYPWSDSAPIEAAAIDHLVVVEGAHDITFDGLAMQGARLDLVAIGGSRDITISNAYLGLAAGSAITIKNSQGIVVERSVVADVGEYGIAMQSDASLPSSNVVVADNIFSKVAQLTRSNRAAILLAGHDNVAVGNEISDLPHQAIVFSGARNSIIGNEISFVNLETSDAGAIYAYHDLTTAYNTIAQNYLHDITTSSALTQVGPARYVRDIYLDSWTSFTNIENNITDTDAMSYYINSGVGNVVRDNTWFLSEGPSGQIYDISHHRGRALGHYVFDDPKSRKLASCSNLAERFDPVFLRDGKSRGNVIARNANIGGQSILVPAALAKAQRISGEKMLPQALIDRSQGLARLLDIARQSGSPIGPYLEAADRRGALQSLRYRNRTGHGSLRPLTD